MPDTNAARAAETNRDRANKMAELYNPSPHGRRKLADAITAALDEAEARGVLQGRGAEMKAYMDQREALYPLAGKIVNSDAVDDKLDLFRAVTSALVEARRTALEEAAQIADEAAAKASASLAAREAPTSVGKTGALCVDVGEKVAAKYIAQAIRALLNPRPAAQPEGDM